MFWNNYTFNRKPIGHILYRYYRNVLIIIVTETGLLVSFRRGLNKTFIIIVISCFWDFARGGGPFEMITSGLCVMLARDSTMWRVGRGTCGRPPPPCLPGERTCLPGTTRVMIDVADHRRRRVVRRCRTWHEIAADR